MQTKLRKIIREEIIRLLEIVYNTSYWILPNGKIVNSNTDHIDYIFDNPARFKLHQTDLTSGVIFKAELNGGIRISTTRGEVAVEGLEKNIRKHFLSIIEFFKKNDRIVVDIIEKSGRYISKIMTVDEFFTKFG